MQHSENIKFGDGSNMAGVMAVISLDTDNTDFCKSTCVKRRKSSSATVFALFHFLYICSLYNSWLCPPAGAGCS